MFFCRGFRQPVLPSGLSRLRLLPPTGGTGPGPAPPFAFGTAAAPKPEFFLFSVNVARILGAAEPFKGAVFPWLFCFASGCLKGRKTFFLAFLLCPFE